MGQMVLSEHCHDIHQMDADRLMAQFETLENNEAEVKQTIGRGTAEARAAVDDQYAVMFPSAYRGLTGGVPDAPDLGR